jgi:branched-chain amino acid transport system ATP-binding protein
MVEPLLHIDALDAGYGKKQVLCGVSLSVAPAEVVGVIGPNGAGKSTLLKAVAGVIKPWAGSVRLDGEEVGPLGPVEMLARRVVYVPQGRVVFDELTVEENLALVSGLIGPSEFKEGKDELFETFPELKTKLKAPASALSGGMKQMLALARAWLFKPKLLLLDEPTLGLSSPYAGSVFHQISRLNQWYEAAVLIVEQKVREVAAFSGRIVAMKLGRVVYDGSKQLVGKKERMREIFL